MKMNWTNPEIFFPILFILAIILLALLNYSVTISNCEECNKCDVDTVYVTDTVLVDTLYIKMKR